MKSDKKERERERERKKRTFAKYERKKKNDHIIPFQRSKERG